MSRTFVAYLDSGANIHSRYKTEITLADMGITDEEFDEMSDEEKDDMFKEYAYECSEWGWYEE